MENKLMTFDEVSQDIKTSEHKRCSLLDKNGNTLVPFNSQKIDIEQRMSEVESRFNSKSTPDGVYQIHAKHFGQKAVAAIYYVCKGEMKNGLADIALESVPNSTTLVSNEPLGFTQEEYQELYRTNMQHEFDIERLELQVAALELELEELDNEEPERQGLLSEDTETFLSKAFDQLAPLADRLLDQRDKKLQIEAAKIVQTNETLNPPVENKADPDPEQRTLNEEEQDQVTDEAHMMTMEYLKENDPQAYANLMNQMADLQDQNDQGQ